MRIAILNRERIWEGGDLVAIDATMAALRGLGVECEYGPKSLEGFDLVHIFHVNYPWSRENFERVRAARLPYVVTPTFYPENRGMEPVEILKYLQAAARVLPFSRWEAEEMCSWIDGRVPYLTIPNGTAPEFFADNAESERAGVIAVAARADDGKRWEVISAACARLAIPFALACERPRSEMPALYKRARLLVSASGTERMSLVIGEALCAGCRVLSTAANRGNEWYGPELRTVDPNGSIEYFMKQIQDAYFSSEWDFSPNDKARQLTWGRTARALLEVYQQCSDGVLC